MRLAELKSRAAHPQLPRRGSIAGEALKLLQRDPELAWRLTEIAETLDLPATSVSPALTRLRERGFVEQVQGHWHALDDAEVAKRQAMRLSNRMADERLGPEMPEDWPRITRE